MYEALTNAYNEANEKSNKRNACIIYHYVLLDANFNETENKGICKNVTFRYDPCSDFNIITFVDVETGKNFSRCQFYVNLTKV